MALSSSHNDFAKSNALRARLSLYPQDSSASNIHVPNVMKLLQKKKTLFFEKEKKKNLSLIAHNFETMFRSLYLKIRLSFRKIIK